jgi:hypothetical protein
MAGHGSKAHKQEETIAALLSSASIPQAATKVGIDESTVDRWLKDPEFRGRYRAARRELVEHSVSLLQRAAGAAVTTLIQLLKRDDQPGVQCRAAVAILEKAFAGTELLDMETRLAAIEATTGKNGKEAP